MEIKKEYILKEIIYYRSILPRCTKVPSGFLYFYKNKKQELNLLFIYKIYNIFSSSNYHRFIHCMIIKISNI